MIGAVFAWSSDLSVVVSEIDALHSLFAKAVGARLRQFRFQHAHVIQDEPGQCGWLALHSLALRLHTQDAETWLVEVIHGFRASLCQDENVRAPLLLGGSPQALLERGLSSLLQEKGCCPTCPGRHCKDWGCGCPGCHAELKSLEAA